MNNNIIAISIKTYNRPKTLIKCVESIQKYCDVPYRLYIADDSPDIDQVVLTLYEKLTKEGHVIIKYSDHVSVTKARNDIVDSIQDEQYVLRLDDDFHFSENTKVSIMLEILKKRSEIGAIADIERQVNDGKGVTAGDISEGQGYRFIDGNMMLKVKVPLNNWIWQNVGEYRFAIANFTRNFLLIKREVFLTVRWNQNLIIHGEHTAFMLDLQKAGWLLAFTPDSMHEHNDPVITEKTYSDKRYSNLGKTKMYEEYKRIYNITTFKNIKLNSYLKEKSNKRNIYIKLYKKIIKIIKIIKNNN